MCERESEKKREKERDGMRANEKKADINQRSEGKKVAAFSLTFLSTNMFCLLIKSCFF